MILSDNEHEVKWYHSDGKMHTVSISAESEDLSIKDLYDKCHKIIKEKEDLCKNIYSLGVCLSGSSSGAWGFLMGWLVRSIKGETNWDINHISEEVPEEEAREYIASIMEEGARLIRQQKDGDKPKGMSPLLGGSDGTELFS